MPYIVTNQSPRTHQITLEEILSGAVDVREMKSNHDPTGTITRIIDRVPSRIMERANIDAMIAAIDGFNLKWDRLHRVADRRSLYHTFHIPKKSGGLRRIDAPCDELKAALRELKDILEVKCGALYHTAAFAYVAGRNTVDSVAKHQRNGSRWFLKTDFSNFFGNTTPEFVLRMLEQIFPFSEILSREGGRSALVSALDLCFLDNGLPQGTPISPMLTNLVMIPIDYAIAKELWSKGYAYTRYADDILVSHRLGFKPDDVVRFIADVVRAHGAPFEIKPEKTRYGSSAGSNWNLGVMLNKDNNITVGYRNKQRFKAMSHSFIEDFKHGVHWEPHDVQVFSGLLSYYMMVEPEYMEKLIAYINQKHQCNLRQMIKAALLGGSMA